MCILADIDIDFPNRDNALLYLQHTPAAMIDHRGNRVKHKSGVYFQDIPVNPEDELAAYDYIRAEQFGYFKIDFLANSIYEGVRDEKHLCELLHREPMWELFLEPEVVQELAHVRDYIHVLQIIVPKSIEDLAVCIALIRPGKKHLLNLPRNEIDKEIWIKPQKDAYYYKKSHATAFAASIVVQLNLLTDSLLD